MEDSAPRSVGVDRFGCPIVDPTPSTLSLGEYIDFCGAACDPYFGQARDEGWFIACVSKQIPLPGAVSDARICVTGPIDGEDYLVSDSGKAIGLEPLCWAPCGSEGVTDARLADSVPERCHE